MTPLEAFLAHAALESGEGQGEAWEDCVQMMTLHSAKGLEFPFVFIVGMEENLFPSMMSLQSRADLEEERRLFYVALTRAERRVSISYAETRYKWGKLDFCEPSRFIDEIDEQYMELPRKSHFSFNQKPKAMGGGIRIKARTVSEKPKLKSSYRKIESSSDRVVNRPTSSHQASDPDEILKGMRVEHQRFGAGEVLEIEGSGSNKKAKVKFADGTKQLILRFARLRVL